MVADVIRQAGLASLSDKSLRIETTDPSAIPDELDFVVCVNHFMSEQPELSVKVVYPVVRVAVFGRELKLVSQKANDIYLAVEGQTGLEQSHEEPDPNDPSQMIRVVDGRVQAFNARSAPDLITIPGPSSQQIVMAAFEIKVCYAYAEP